MGGGGWWEAGGGLHHPTGLFGVAMSPRSANHTRAAEAIFDRSSHNQICHHCLCGASTDIVCKAHVHAKHANSRGVWGHAPPENF